MGPKNSFSLFLLFLASLTKVYSQPNPLFCTAGAVPVPVRLEGLAERLGDIVVTCTGGTPGQVVKGNITVYLPVNITNRLFADGSTDAVLTVDVGSSPVAQILTSTSLTFAGITFTVPPAGGVNIRVSNLRAAVNSLNTQPTVDVGVTMDGLGILSLRNNRLTVAILNRGLLATFAQAGIRCVGSPLPDTISMTNLFAKGTRFASTRITEGFASAFQPGTRFLVSYSGLPAGARLFVPDLVAGSDAVQPTAGGDLGLPQSIGQYAAGSGALLLARVLATDPTGAGGVSVLNSMMTSLDSATEVAISNGAAFAVYEVVDANPAIVESAQFPTFLGIPPVTNGATSVAQESLSFAPVSTVNTASASAPVPRFVSLAPPSDCPALRDCDASYFPSLHVDAQPMQFTAFTGGAALQPPGYVAIRNEGGGILNWTASVIYKSGADWIWLDTPSGFNNGSVRVWIRPEKLPAGTYEATLIIDAGPLAGTRSFPVLLSVTSLPPVKPTITVSTVTNAADYRPGPVVPGSLAMIKGSNLAGKDVSVTFDGLPAKLMYTSDTQINLLVPPELAAKTSSKMMVTVDGRSSDPQAVALAAVWPAIFAGGIVNQDNTVNSPDHAAPVGTVIAIYLTGIPADGAGVWVRIHDRDNLVPLYAGAAPTLPGVQQVNAMIPPDLPQPMMTSVKICATGADGQPVCSLQAPIAFGQ